MKFLIKKTILLGSKYVKKINVLTIVGTRPEIIRLSSILKSFDKYFNHILVHTGQNYDYELTKFF